MLCALVLAVMLGKNDCLSDGAFLKSELKVLKKLNSIMELTL